MELPNLWTPSREIPPGEAELRLRFGGMTAGAEFDGSEKHRLLLWRIWGPQPLLGFWGLNPSTAGATADDNTVRVCVGRAQRLGCGGMVIGNIYTYRAREPRDLWRSPVRTVDPEHTMADLVARGCPTVICAWGGDAKAEDVGRAYARLKAANPAGLYCLGRTKEGFPRHPLYVPYRKGPEPYAL